ncbi:sensor domain-containing diguanylate cyclase [Blastococcus tunisiensis]|uniref:Diguanylate cyclase (GGDEF) domain-containing protein n=1 Tax=Blastococcus tunisiensis TaxID=1798228 RepID=A0A1I2KFZ0_9ACTN|nr:sensor domain-containing diguanylate cyclase [Blastococcus sp. DSM 46838]SFF65140.1 diguanylate cyclase (GGDEF) domain-containing protein [Blastococcus sp. DSM 46838]
MTTTGRRHPRARPAALVHEFGVPGPSADPELDGIVRLAAAVTGLRYAAVNTLDTPVKHALAAHGFRATATPRDESIGFVLARRGAGVQTVEDLTAVPEFAGNPWVDGRRGRVRAYASAPIVVDDVLLGALSVFDDEPHAFTPDDCGRLDDLAAVAVSLFRARQQASRLADLAAAGQLARADLERAHARLVRSTAFTSALLDALPVGVVAGDAEGRLSLFNRVSREWHGVEPDPAVAVDELPGVFRLTDAQGAALPPDLVPLTRVYREGRVADVEMGIAAPGRPLRLVTASGTTIRGDDQKVLGALVTLVDVTAQRELERALRAAALHDPLTGLPNRSLLLDRLEQSLSAARRAAEPAAVLYCDLDGFKPVNDVAGHAVGDEVLVDAGRRLASAVRPGDTVARIGGDEFVVLCPSVRGEEAAQEIAGRVAAAFGTPLHSADGTAFDVGISIGVALCAPEDTPESALEAADAAMYRVKAAGRLSRG